MKIKTELVKAGKRVLSLVLCIIMLATTFFIFDPSILGLNASAKVDYTKKDLGFAGSGTSFAEYSINMPELVYLAPGTNKSKEFLNNLSNGEKDGTTSTEGTFAFSCSTASGFKLYATLCDKNLNAVSSPTLSSVTLADSDTYSYSRAAGKTGEDLIFTFTSGSVITTIKSLTLSSASSGNEYIIQWRYVYTINGADYTTYSYTGVRCPSLEQAGMATYSKYDDVSIDAYSFITGVDSVSGGNAKSNFVNPASGTINPAAKIAPLCLFRGSMDNSEYTMPNQTPGGSSGVVKLAANGTQSDYFSLSSGKGVFIENNTGVESAVWFVNGFDQKKSTASNFKFKDEADPAHSKYNTTYGMAHITVDISRYSNFNQIPNLSCGWASFGHESKGDGSSIQNIRNCAYVNGDAGSYDKYYYHDMDGEEWVGSDYFISINGGSIENKTTAESNHTEATIYCSNAKDRVPNTKDTNTSYARGLYPIAGDITEATTHLTGSTLVEQYLDTYNEYGYFDETYRD